MEPDVQKHLTTRIAAAPVSAGVYRWLDKTGSVVYVGKAKNLRNRLRSYLQKGSQGPWKDALMRLVQDFDITVTNNELEALVLETNLIKQLRPKYNVLMKDDKNYVYVRISAEEYPRVEVVRQMDSQKAKYFGPYLSAWEARRLLDLLNELFPFRSCRESLEGLNKSKIYSKDAAPCLGFHIGQCIGLCVAAMSQQQYKASIDEVVRFYKGDHDIVKARLKELMQEAATQKKFERAAHLRDDLLLIERMEEKQLVSDPSAGDADFVGVKVLAGRAHVVLFLQRDGKIIGETHYSLMGQAENISDVLEQFLPQYYESTQDIPDNLFVPEEFDERTLFEEYLSLKKGKKVTVTIPERGKKSHLMELAAKNAEEKARQRESRWEADARNTKEALGELQQLLNLEKPPVRIECYDISHLGGTETAGSMVVFKNAKPATDHYRSFGLRTLKDGEVDDYKALKEVLKRRLRHLGLSVQEEEKTWKQEGYVFRKAHKADQAHIASIRTEQLELSTDPVAYKDFFVGLKDAQIVAMGRLRKYPKKILEIQSLWVSPGNRGSKLGQFLVRKILKNIKKGKLYLLCEPSLEEFYAEVGFRYIHKTPAVITEQRTQFLQEHSEIRELVPMVYDTIQNKIDPSFASRPDLIVVDGGKGQLSSVMEVINELKVDIPTIGLAKREEDVFLPGNPDPIPFPKDAPSKFLLMRLRDEALRFANKLRETRGGKKAIHSVLDDIPGIGPKTRKDLLDRFGTVDGIRMASDTELSRVLNATQLKEIRAKL